MHHFTASLCLLVILVLTGCQTRSISNSGYGSYYTHHNELSELTVLGIDSLDTISESDIHNALNQSDRISISRSAKVVLIQSGAAFPDDAFMKEMESLYRVVPLSGIPNRASTRFSMQNAAKDSNDPPLDKTIRLTAARAGATTIIVYWGILESSRRGYYTKTVSWVPILGSVVPDEHQLMRLRLKAAIIDVASGNWEMLYPEVYEDKQVSTHLSRKQRDQDQVELLKQKGYKRLVSDIKTRFES